MATKGERKYAKGANVEVDLNQDDTPGPWYAAEIVDGPYIRITNIWSYDVRYRDLLDYDKNWNVRKVVEEKHIRPVPPRGKKKVFKESDWVDAWLDKGWWEGVVVEALENRRFRVYVRASMEVKKVKKKYLRVHWEWIDRRWFPPVVDHPAQEDDDVDGSPGVTDITKPL